ncbi:MAG: hypothetical protein SWC96_05170 [Thermodesulfobacteriota bacterium]|nr:hypothetical protein [Thermodesulfobacteriota bacterium]
MTGQQDGRRCQRQQGRRKAGPDQHHFPVVGVHVHVEDRHNASGSRIGAGAEDEIVQPLNKGGFRLDLSIDGVFISGIWINRFLLDPDPDFDSDNENRECLLWFGIPCRRVDMQGRVRAGW